jgi:hypothetical protein
MARIFSCKAFPLKHMAQVSFTIGTNYFDAVTIGIRHPLHSARNFIIKAGPATMRVKFIS